MPNFFNVLTVSHSLLSRFVVILALCSFYLQGCRSVFQVTPGEPSPKKARKTSDDEQPSDQFPVPSRVYDGGPLVATSVNSPSSLATSAVPINSPTRHLAVASDVISSWQALPTESEGIDTKPAARPISVFGARAWRRYLGEVGVAPPLPSEIDKILHSLGRGRCSASSAFRDR